jgi:Carboxypeptidase regulatory-like domain
MPRLAYLLLTAASLAQTAAAQVVHGVLVSAEDNQPVPYGTVRTIVGADTIDRFTNSNGQFALGDLPNGAYHVRARMLGYTPLDTTITVDAARTPLVLRIALLPFRLATVPVTAKRNLCIAGIPNETTDRALGAIFDQLRINAERYHLLIDKYPFRYLREEIEFIRTNNRTDSLTSADTTMYDSRDRRRYKIGSVVYQARAATGGGLQTKMYLPTFADLADSSFDDAHCFAYVGRRRNEIEIDFHPIPSITTPDVDGSIFLDATTYIVRRAVFHLTKPGEMDPPVIGLTVTTTFYEVVPLVPVFRTARGEQPLPAIRTDGYDPQTHQYHPLVQRVSLEHDSVLSHTFIGDTIGSQTVSVAPASAPPPKPPPPLVAISLGCSMPPSFETDDIGIYGTLTGDHLADADRVLTAIRHQYHMPDNIALPVYGFAVQAKTAPTVTGEVAFGISGGHLTSLDLTATSLSTILDSLLIAAVRHADTAGGFVGIRSGRYELSLSSAKPDAGAHAILFAAVSAAVIPLVRKATIDSLTPAPHLPSGTGVFQFVVDEQGHALQSTLETVTTSSPEFTRALAHALIGIRFTPAMSGTCPIKQVVRQLFAGPRS